MIRVSEKYYTKQINKIGNSYYGRQNRKRTTYWLLFIIPIFITDRVESGDYEKY